MNSVGGELRGNKLLNKLAIRPNSTCLSNHLWCEPNACIAHEYSFIGSLTRPLEHKHKRCISSQSLPSHRWRGVSCRGLSCSMRCIRLGTSVYTPKRQRYAEREKRRTNEKAMYVVRRMSKAAVFRPAFKTSMIQNAMCLNAHAQHARTEIAQSRRASAKRHSNTAFIDLHWPP